MNYLTEAWKGNSASLLLEANLLGNDILITSWFLHFLNNCSDLKSGLNLTNPQNCKTRWCWGSYRTGRFIQHCRWTQKLWEHPKAELDAPISLRHWETKELIRQETQAVFLKLLPWECSLKNMFLFLSNYLVHFLFVLPACGLLQKLRADLVDLAGQRRAWLQLDRRDRHVPHLRDQLWIRSGGKQLYLKVFRKVKQPNRSKMGFFCSVFMHQLIKWGSDFLMWAPIFCSNQSENSLSSRITPREDVSPLYCPLLMSPGLGMFTCPVLDGLNPPLRD